MSHLPTALQFSNSTIVEYKDVSYSNHVRNGKKEALIQNRTTNYDDDISHIRSQTEIDCVFKYSKELKKLTDERNKELKKKHINAKELGVTSQVSKRKLTRVIENIVNTIYICGRTERQKSKLFACFLTLTLPSKQCHTDSVINKQLVRFIENLKQSKGVLNYVWKAEPQENGNIHYHLLLDKFIPKDYLQQRWNSQINKLGYVDRSKSSNPPTTRVESLRKIKNVVAYISKYMTKPENNKRPITAKLWGASRSALKMKNPKILVEEMTPYVYGQMRSILSKLKLYNGIEYMNLYTGKVFELVRNQSKTIWNMIKDHYKETKRLAWKEAFDLTEKIETFTEKQEKKLKAFREEINQKLRKIVQTEIPFPANHTTINTSII